MKRDRFTEWNLHSGPKSWAFSFLKIVQIRTLRTFLCNWNQRHFEDWGLIFLQWHIKICCTILLVSSIPFQNEWNDFKKQSFQEPVLKRKISIFKTWKLEKNHDDKSFSMFLGTFEFLQFSGVPSATRYENVFEKNRTWNNQSENFPL